MAPCEMCGRDTELVKASIENVVMSVCAECGKYGKVFGTPVKFAPKKEKPKAPEPIESIVDDYAILIKNAREHLGLTQLDLGKKIAEHETLIHHIESGKMKPSIELAAKLEKFFRIKLIEIPKDVIVPSKATKGEITLGDLAVIRKR
jgi:putative transcription factor